VNRKDVEMRVPKARSFDQLEDLVNQTLGLDDTKGSGSVAGDGDGKGRDRGLDSTYSQLLSECKYTEKTSGSVTIKKKDFWKTESAALRLGRVAAMFKADADGEVYCVIKLGDFADIYRSHIENKRRRDHE